MKYELKAILFIFISFELYSAKLLVYSEDKSTFDINISGFEKGRGKIFFLNINEKEEIDIICNVGINEIQKKIYISENDFFIYAISKESNEKYNIRYRGEGYENLSFLKLENVQKVILNEDKSNIHIIEEEKKEDISITKNTNKSVDRTLNSMFNKKENKSKIVSRDYYNGILNKLENLEIDMEKMVLIKKSFNKNKKVDSNQAIKILSTIDNEVVRLEVAKSIYKYCGEQEKLKENLMDIFVYDYTRRQLKNHLN